MASPGLNKQDSAIVASQVATSPAKSNEEANSTGASTSGQEIRTSSKPSGPKSPRTFRQYRNRSQRGRTQSASSVLMQTNNSDQQRLVHQQPKQIKFNSNVQMTDHVSNKKTGGKKQQQHSNVSPKPVFANSRRMRAMSDSSSMESRRTNRSRNRSFVNPQQNSNKMGWSTDYVSREIMNYYQRNRQSNEKYKSKQILRRSLENTLKQGFTNYYINLHIIGSTTNGIGDNAAMVDICIMATKKPTLATGRIIKDEENSNRVTDSDEAKNNVKSGDNEVKPKVEAEETVLVAAADSNTGPYGESDEEINLHQIDKILRSKNFAQNIVLIPARVPVIKFKDVICNLNVTLNLNQEVSIFNTQLIRDYTKMDWRFAHLAMIVKRWAAENRINSAVDKTISPYSWTLMVVHYLQTLEPPVLPCLQQIVPRRYNAPNVEEAINIWRNHPANWHSRNNSTLKQLMKGFFRYYAYVFNYEQHIISVRQGKAINRVFASSEFDENAHQWNVLLCVEEPFTLTNTTRSVHDPVMFQRIRDLLRIASNALKGNRLSLFNIIINDLDFPNYH